MLKNNTKSIAFIKYICRTFAAVKDLSRHIEYLLTEQTSIAIPGIGMFTTEELPAKYYSEENIYIPPVRSVHFNSAITEDDGKLENCLIQLHRVTRGVAKKWITEYLDHINQSLMEANNMPIGTIGQLVLRDGKIEFEVCDAGVNSPELYGLDSFHFEKLPSYAHKNRIIKDPTHVTIRLRRSTVRRAMTAAAMIIVALTVIVPNHGFFTQRGFQAKLASTESIVNIFNRFPQPISNSSNPEVTITPEPIIVADNASKQNTLATEQTSVVVCDMVAITPAEPIQSQEVVAESTTETTEVQIVTSAEIEVAETIVQPTVAETVTEEKEAPVQLEAKGYCVVMASAITHKGAALLINKLAKEGFTNAVKHTDNGMLRVVLTGFPNEEAARATLAIVRATDDTYSGSWIKKF